MIDKTLKPEKRMIRNGKKKNLILYIIAEAFKEVLSR